MPPKKKTNEQAQAIIEKAQELNALFAKLPKNPTNTMTINNINQAIQFLINMNFKV